jgi:hypothetical protein
MANETDGICAGFMQTDPSPGFVMIDYPLQEHEDKHTNPSDLQQVLIFLADLHRQASALQPTNQRSRRSRRPTKKRTISAGLAERMDVNIPAAT